MKEPRRLVHEHPSALARSLLKAAITEEPRTSLLSSTLMLTIGTTGVALAQTSATAAAASLPPSSLATATATSASSIGIKSAAWLAATAKWVGIAGVGGVLTVTGVRTLKVTRTSPTSAAQLARPPTSAAAKLREALAPVSSATQPIRPSPEPDDTVPASSATRLSKSIAPASSPTGSALALQLSEEARVIDEARAAVARGDGPLALRILENHRKKFERPRLRPEALYLRMQALRVSGNTEAAMSVAEQLLYAYPSGPQSAAARALLNSQGR